MAMRMATARTAWLESTVWSNALPVRMHAEAAPPYSLATSRIWPAGSTVMGSAHSGVYCCTCGTSSSKPWHQRATKSAS